MKSYQSRILVTPYHFARPAASLTGSYISDDLCLDVEAKGSLAVVGDLTADSTEISSQTPIQRLLHTSTTLLLLSVLLFPVFLCSCGRNMQIVQFPFRRIPPPRHIFLVTLFRNITYAFSFLS